MKYTDDILLNKIQCPIAITFKKDIYPSIEYRLIRLFISKFYQGVRLDRKVFKKKFELSWNKNKAKLSESNYWLGYRKINKTYNKLINLTNGFDIILPFTIETYKVENISVKTSYCIIKSKYTKINYSLEVCRSTYQDKWTDVNRWNAVQLLHVLLANRKYECGITYLSLGAWATRKSIESIDLQLCKSWVDNFLLSLNKPFPIKGFYCTLCKEKPCMKVFPIE